MEQSTLFIRTRFEQEEHIYLHDEDDILPNGMHKQNIEPQLNYQILKIDPVKNFYLIFIFRRQIFDRYQFYVVKFLLFE